jgi:asparagine synthase (glutamine-hydrolysing)
VCGIAGIFNFRDEKVSVRILKNMLAQIQYRGPDESGIYSKDNIGLGSVRLSIIDLSSGQQPISNHDDTLWIVYNGEVFNYLELRELLIKKGISFKTDSDTEVVLKYYEIYGENCLEYFNGQFAIAIWDTNKQELFLARDRIGIRPLFYTLKDNTFVFGSEIKTLFEHPAINAELDFQLLNEVFTFWTTLSPNTCFKGIYELPPGHYMKVTAANTEIKKYWSLKFPQKYAFDKTDIKKAVDAFDELIEDSVRLRLRADVPVAAYLSGGLDSSATTYYIKKIARDRLQTFSIGFTDKEFDESSYQNEVSNFLKTQHTGFKCSNNDIAVNFPDVIWHTEFPILRTAPVPMYCLSKNVRENNIKVVITGEGADEMLGGYDIFKELVIRRFWSKYPNSYLRPSLLKKLYPYIPALQSQNSKMLKFFFGYKLMDLDSPYYSHLLRWNNASRITGFLSKDIFSDVSKTNVYARLDAKLDEDFNSWSPLGKAQWLESTIFMSGYLLSSQGDRMAMANSVEGRYPFLDYRVMEFCASLHPDLKLNGLNEKYLLKQTMIGRLPESVLKRPKQAYRAPIASSFIGPGAPSYVNELTSAEKINEFGIFDFERVNSLMNKISSGPASEMENMSVAAILSTQLLYKNFVKEKPKAKTLDNCRVISP